MADIVYSLLYRPAGCEPDRCEQMADMARLWASHLRGPGQHRGPILLLTNAADLAIAGAELIPIPDTPRTGRHVLPLKVTAAFEHLHPAPADRIMQLDIDSLARRPLQPMFDGIRPGEMRTAPSRLHLLHWQQAGRIIPRWKQPWYAWRHGWWTRIGVSSSATACTGSDWPAFLGRWSEAIRRFDGHFQTEPIPGDQAYLNYLYALKQIPMRPYSDADLHHLRLNESPQDPRAVTARILHFPLPDKLRHMRAWSLLPTRELAAA